MVRFHESLAAAAQAAVAQGVDLSTAVIVRDGLGRLVLGVPEWPNHETLRATLVTALGGYAGPVPVISGKPVRRLEADPGLRTVEVSSPGKAPLSVRYIDRRFAGADWLRTPSTPPAKSPQRLVFGSLKGGVGRSTALAVLAADLSRAGKSVLAIDLDLEAPGIGFLLLPQNNDLSLDRRPAFGALDYLVEEGLSGIADSDIADFVGVSPFCNSGAIDVVPAVGRSTDDNPITMLAKLSVALVEGSAESGGKTVADRLISMIERLSNRRPYDAILIDARAGMSEFSAAPLLSLGAEILLFGTDQQQTFRGYAYLLSHMVGVTDFSKIEEDTDWRERITFVHAKSPPLARDRARFRERLYELCAEQLYNQIAEDTPEASLMAPSPSETGEGIPHDATHIRTSDHYQLFDPTLDDGVLDTELYEGIYGDFLRKSWRLLGFDRDNK